MFLEKEAELLREVLWYQKANKKLTALYERVANGESIGHLELERRASIKYSDFSTYKVFSPS